MMLLKFAPVVLFMIPPVLLSPAHSAAGGDCATPLPTPTMTAFWDVASTTKCNSGQTCSDGMVLDGLPDTVGTNNTTDHYGGYAGGRTVPTYTANQINGLPAALFTNYLAAQDLTASSAPLADFTFYAVWNMTGSGDNVLMGEPQWEINFAGQQRILWNGTYVLGTTTFTTGQWYATAVTGNASTGVVHMYVLAHGAATPDGGSNTGTQANPTVSYIGFSNMYIAAAGYYSGTSDVNALANYTYCKYHI